MMAESKHGYIGVDKIERGIQDPKWRGFRVINSKKMTGKQKDTKEEAAR